MKNYFLLAVTFLLLFSCVPYKNTVYFQGNPVSKEDVYMLNTTPYKLQINDILSINIKSENKELVALFSNNSSSENSSAQNNQSSLYFNGYSIDGHGNIRLPYLGELNVLGYNTEEVRQKIEMELRKYINFANSIFVTVKLSGIPYTILGEISSPGTTILYKNKVTLIEAISNSGDITNTGNRKKIEVIRNTFEGVKKYSIDLTSIDAFDSEVFTIQPNDIIYITPLKRKTWGIGTTGLESVSTITGILTTLATIFLLTKSL